MNYSKIIKNDFTAGDGVCVSLFVSGCALRCPGCHNPESWNPEFGKEFSEETVLEILEALGANGITRNLCIMGGDPFYKDNIETILALVKTVNEYTPNTKVYVWTGYTYEDLYHRPNYQIAMLLQTIDYLIDGPYIQEERDITLKMRGSRNQRILKLKDGCIVEDLS